MLIKFQLKSNLQANKLLHSSRRTADDVASKLFFCACFYYSPTSVHNRRFFHTTISTSTVSWRRRWKTMVVGKFFSSSRRSHSLASLAKIIWMEKLLSRRHENVFYFSLSETPRSLAGNVNGTVSCFFCEWNSRSVVDRVCLMGENQRDGTVGIEPRQLLLSLAIELSQRKKKQISNSIN